MSRKNQNREQIVQESLVSTVNLFVKFTFHSMQALLMSCCGGGGEAGRFQHLGVFFSHFPGLLPLQGWKKMGGNRSQRDMSICFLKLRDRGSKMWMWKPGCVWSTVQERAAVLPGWKVIHSTHYLCHLQGSVKLREDWNSPWVTGRDNQSGICHNWDVHSANRKSWLV